MDNVPTETPPEAPPAPAEADEDQQPEESGVDDTQKAISIETFLQLHSLEVDRALALNEDLFRSEELSHESDGFDRYWKYILEELGSHVVEHLNESDAVFENMQERARENFEKIKVKHQEFCEKTYNAAIEEVEETMVLTEAELRDEELFHGGDEKIRNHLMRKIRDLKKRLPERMYERLLEEVINPLLDKLVDESKEKHQEFCEKTYNEAIEEVENNMVLDPSELEDGTLFEQGEQAVRARLLRKIRDLGKRLPDAMYEKLEREVINPLLDDRVAEYMNQYNDRIKEPQEDKEPDKADEATEEGGEEGDGQEAADAEAADSQAESDSAAEAAQEGSEASAESTTETTAESSSENSGESATTSESAQSQDSSGTESSQSTETGQSQQATQASESSQANQANQATESAATSESATVTSSSKQAEKNEKEVPTKPQEHDQAEKAPETSQFAQLAGVRQLFSKGEHHFQPFLAEWEKSLDSAQHRKAIHEITTKAKTAKDLVAWLLTAQEARTSILQKKHPAAWKKFHHGMQLFGFARAPENEGMKAIPEEGPEEPDEQRKEIENSDVEDQTETIENIEVVEEMELMEAVEEVDEPLQEEEMEVDEEAASLEAEMEEDTFELFADEPISEESSPEELFAQVLAHSTLETTLEIDEETDLEEEIEEEEEELEVKSQTNEEFLENPAEFLAEEEDDTELAEEEIQEIDATIEDLEEQLEEDEELQEEIDAIEESLVNNLDQLLLDFDDLDEFTEEDFGIEGMDDEIANLHELFALLVEESTMLEDTEVEDFENEDPEQRESPTPRNLRRFLLLLHAAFKENGEQEDIRPMNIKSLLEGLAKQLNGMHGPDAERRILNILRYYPQFRFLLLMLLRKYYLQSGNQDYLQLMMLIFQEQHTTKGLSLQEITAMLQRFLRFIGTNPEIHYCIHEALHDYAVLNPNELLQYLSHHICNFKEHIARINFISQPHHCRFDHFSGRAKALLHMNMEGNNHCQKAIGKSRLTLMDHTNLEAA